MRITLTSILLLLVACGSDSPPGGGRRDSGPAGGVDSGPMMGTDSGPTMMGTDSGPTMMGTDSGPTMMGTDSGPTMMGMGACTNASDMMLMAMHDMDMVVGDCAEMSFGDGNRTRDCVIMRTMISMPCGQCWGDATGCTVMRCIGDCFGGDSPACSACRDAMGCTSEFETCSGLMSE
jgi:hypothetical protein